VVALGLLVRGVPAFYINGLIAAPNYEPPQGLDENRTINREIFLSEPLFARLDQEAGPMRMVLGTIKELIYHRKKAAAFDPSGPPAVPLNSNNDAVLAVSLAAAKDDVSLVAVINLSASHQETMIELINASTTLLRDLLQDNREFVVDAGVLRLELAPYDVLWLR
jgi:hypothetical protein